MESNLLIDVTGWAGVTGLLLAYLFVSTKRIEGDSVLYQVLNLAGAVLLSINSLYYGAYPSVGINILWIGVGIYALVSKGAKQRSEGPTCGDSRSDG